MIEMRTKWCEFWDILHHFGGWMCWFWTCQPRHLQSACHGLLGQKFWCGWIRDIGIGKEPQWQGTLGKSSLHRRNALGTPRHKLWPGSLPQAQEDKSGFRTCTSHRFIMVYLYSSLSFWFENFGLRISNPIWLNSTEWLPFHHVFCEDIDALLGKHVWWLHEQMSAWR